MGGEVDEPLGGAFGVRTRPGASAHDVARVAGDRVVVSHEPHRDALAPETARHGEAAVGAPHDEGAGTTAARIGRCIRRERLRGKRHGPAFPSVAASAGSRARLGAAASRAPAPARLRCPTTRFVTARAAKPAPAMNRISGP